MKIMAIISPQKCSVLQFVTVVLQNKKYGFLQNMNQLPVSCSNKYFEIARILAVGDFLMSTV